MEKKRIPSSAWLIVSALACCIGVCGSCIPWGGLKLHNPEIHSAAAAGNAAEVEGLLDSGVSVDLRNENGETPLFYALYKGQYNVAKYLLNRGADVNARDRTGDSALDKMLMLRLRTQADWLKLHGGLTFRDHSEGSLRK